MINVIGDIAGEFDALMRLMEILPIRPTVLVGDLNDRGPDSRKVIEWAMSAKTVTTLHSNHGDLFVDFVLGLTDPEYEARYHPMDFLNNGGGATLRSYGAHDGMSFVEAARLGPREHIEWLRTRPLVYDGDDIVVSHAPLVPGVDIGRLNHQLDQSTKELVVWHRDEPSPRSQFQVFGHNSNWGIRKFDRDNKTWAICIDSSRTRQLTGFAWPEQKLFSVPYEVERAVEPMVR